MTEIVMPRLSDTMEEGTILRWLRAEGEEIARGQELVEIETDKANMTYESDAAGVLEIVAAEGETLPVGAVIARVGGEGPALEGPAAVQRSELPQAPSHRTVAPAEPSPQMVGDGERVRASPVARRIASERGLDLHGVAGTGPGGRIVKADVEERAAEAPAAAAAPASSAGSAPAANAKGESSTVELNRLQQTVARRMAEAKATIPDFSLAMDVDMEACAQLRGELKAIAQPDSDEPTPTYNDMVVKACALALREHPHANSSYRDGSLQLHSRINVGVAVAAEGSLVVPTVFDADAKALGEIARETRRLAARVRDGSITPPELGGGTFTVSNLGMYGVRSFAPIINPPQAAILAVGAVEQRAIVRDGEIAARWTMTITLVSDHRILYGAEAAELAARIRDLLQAPASLTL